jgi:N-acyl-D-amino-acid deacylase
MEAFAEAIAICERAGLPLQISHIKLGTTGVWGRAAEVFRMVTAAQKRGVDVQADCYPYEAWHANIEVIVPDKKYDDPDSVALGIRVLGGPDRITITNCEAHRDWQGKNMAEIARAENTTPVALFSRIVKEGGADVIGHSMREEDVLAFYRQPWVMVASDGGIGSEHPRGTGTFPKVLGRFVREKKVISLPEAIRKMTSMPARRLKLADRGAIRKGARADLVLFDPATVIDHSTFEKPEELSTGIRLVLVNGEPVWENGKATGKHPGRVLRGPETRDGGR